MFGSPLHLAPHAISNQGRLSIAMAMLVRGKLEVPGSIPLSSRVFCDFFTALREWAGPAGDAPVRGNVFMLHCRATVIVPASLPMGRPSRGLSPVRRVEIGRNARRIGTPRNRSSQLQRWAEIALETHKKFLRTQKTHLFPKNQQLSAVASMSLDESS